MTEHTSLAPWIALAGQALLRSDVTRIRIPDDETPPEFAGLADEIRLAQGAPEAAGVEYVRLFLSPIGAACPPWQSVYGPEGHLLASEHHSALAWYRRFAVEPQSDSEPADHAGLLLLFYARLLGEAGDDDLRQFREEHLAWLPKFLGPLGQEARHPLYLSLARCLSSILGESKSPVS
jgi:TorA maturation chaperone TorD